MQNDMNEPMSSSTPMPEAVPTTSPTVEPVAMPVTSSIDKPQPSILLWIGIGIIVTVLVIGGYTLYRTFVPTPDSFPETATEPDVAMTVSEEVGTVDTDLSALETDIDAITSDLDSITSDLDTVQ